MIFHFEKSEWNCFVFRKKTGVFLNQFLYIFFQNWQDGLDVYLCNMCQLLLKNLKPSISIWFTVEADENDFLLVYNKPFFFDCLKVYFRPPFQISSDEELHKKIRSVRCTLGAKRKEVIFGRKPEEQRAAEYPRFLLPLLLHHLPLVLLGAPNRQRTWTHFTCPLHQWCSHRTLAGSSRFIESTLWCFACLH